MSPPACIIHDRLDLAQLCRLPAQPDKTLNIADCSEREGEGWKFVF